jgi:hypothetical protein
VEVDVKVGRLGTQVGIALSLALLSSSAANAVEVLTYTGNDFTNVQSPYTTSDKVTATIELLTPLGSSLPLSGVDPISFGISDGQQTITQTDSIGAEFAFATDSSGNIIEWGIYVPSSMPTGALIESYNENLGASPIDEGNNPGSTSYGSVYDLPGTWPITSVPEPPTLYLFGAGLLGVVFLGKWRRASLHLAQ